MHHQTLPFGGFLDDCLCVYGVVERLAHAPVFKGVRPCVKPNVDKGERRLKESLILLIRGVSADLINLVTRDNRLFQVPLQELGKPLF